MQERWAAKQAAADAAAAQQLAAVRDALAQRDGAVCRLHAEAGEAAAALAERGAAISALQGELAAAEMAGATARAERDRGRAAHQRAAEECERLQARACRAYEGLWLSKGSGTGLPSATGSALRGRGLPRRREGGCHGVRGHKRAQPGFSRVSA